jgi:hypothetical protein
MGQADQEHADQPAFEAALARKIAFSSPQSDRLRR